MKDNTLSFDALPALPPLSSFDLTIEGSYCKNPDSKKLLKKPYLLPVFSDLHDEEVFAEVGFAWNEGAVIFEVKIDKPFEEAFFPEIASGDSVELFIDTRDIKTTATLTRFCHHFAILPQKIDVFQAKEITRFRGEESHPLCDPSSINIETTFKSKFYLMRIEFTLDALFGFQPEQFHRLGFTYRINRLNGDPQHFSATSDFFAVEKHPNLWASIQLKGGPL